MEIIKLPEIENRDGKYVYTVSYGGGTHYYELIISCTEITCSYKDSTMGNKNEGIIKFKILQKITNNYYLLLSDNHCLYFLLFFDSIPSYITTGASPMPFMANCPKWNKLSNLMIFHYPDCENNDCKKYLKILNNKQFSNLVPKYYIRIPKQIYSLINSKENTGVIIAYTTPFIYNQKLEVLISESILNNKTLPKNLYIDMMQNVYFEKTIGKISDKPIIYDDGHTSFGPGNNNDNINSLLFVTEMLNYKKEIINAFMEANLTILNENYEDCDSNNIIDNISIYTETHDDLLFISLHSCNWTESPETIFNKHNVIHNSNNIYFLYKDKIIDFGELHYCKINNKRMTLSGFDQIECEEVLNNH